MHLAACLPSDLLARIQCAIRASDDLLHASDWAELAGLLREHPVDLLILDPTMHHADPAPESGADAASPLAILAQFRGIQTIAYTAYTREAMRALLPFARSGVQHVVLRGFDDTRERLRDLIEQAGARILGQRLLSVILPRLQESGAPAEVGDAIGRLFQSPESFRTVQQLATAAGRKRGMLDRWLRRAGLAPAKVIMIAARVAWVHHYAQSPGNRFKVLALRLGYPGTLPMSRHVKWLTGLTPTMLRRELSDDDLVDVLLRWIVPQREAHR